MADEQQETNQEEECSENNGVLTAKQKKNKKKKLAAKKKKQEQREKGDCCGTNTEEKTVQDTKTPQEKIDEELSWCISQLEIGLTRQKPDKTTAQYTENLLKSLKSPKTPLPKKRQIMFSVFGDYRKKIQEEKKPSHLKDSPKPLKVFSVKKSQQKSVFIRVSHIQEKDVSESSLNSHSQEESLGTSDPSTLWKFQPSSSHPFKFNFDDPE